MITDTHTTNQKRRLHIPAVVYFIILAVGCIPEVWIRYRQLIDGTNLETGYYSGPELYQTVLFAIIAELLLLVILFSLLDRNRYQVTLSENNLLLVRITALFSAVFSIASGGVVLYQSLSEPGMTSGMDLVMVLFAFLSAMGFLYFIWRLKQKTAGVSDIMLCLPCLWSCILLLSMFLKHMIVMTVTENIINILFVSGLCVFLLNAAKMTAGTAQPSCGRWLVISGSFTIITGLCATLPLFFLWVITGQEYVSEHVLTATPLEFIVLLFVIAFYIQYLMTRKKLEAKE